MVSMKCLQTISVAYLKKQTTNHHHHQQRTENLWIMCFCSSLGLPSAGQLAALGQAGPMSQVCKQLCWAGPWLLSAVSQFKAQLAGEI